MTNHYTYPRPKNAVGLFLWKRQMWFESTFALSMLEPWEKCLVMTILLTLMTLVTTGLYSYVPVRVVEVQRRAIYYLFGRGSPVRAEL
ncbi:hypothetical protein FIBSPDRAFT_947957 [Athelia psychrophila]|uniref:Uncharacterized protein n=1 Tax=Athelia psychrophila TaxID=1759441 RepID=A0A166R9R2_9AGAM|nr:hypothetical protein FIBSPDRAFT_947957 [Fibularhizoctonia sp. CBS 109695]